MTSPALAVEATGIVKRYRDKVALQGVDLAVTQGCVFGLLGPNGAGKTTLVRVLATLLEPDEGHAVVAGFDVQRQAREVRSRIGYVGQYAAVDDQLTGRENLELVGRLLHMGKEAARSRADALLAQFELLDAGGRRAGVYSGGMRRRLDLASCLVGAPSVLFLDEPTTGLDPPSRMALWQAVRSLVHAGVTVLLTTQYLEEADALADRVAVTSDGRIVAEGTPEELKRKVGQERLVVAVADRSQWQLASAVMSRVATGDIEIDERKSTITLALREPLADTGRAAQELAAAGVRVDSFALRRPTLDDVFMHLTGQLAGPPQDDAVLAAAGA